jgi:Membrane protein involved in the export of O-antigen and teichoic acid
MQEQEEGLKEKTARGLFWGGLSNGIQQLLNLIFGILLARILSRSDYGMIGMLTIFSLIASSLQESGFTAALANKKEIRHKDYNAVFWFSILIALSLYIILYFCAPLIAKFYNVPELTALARYSFLGFLISSLGTAQSAYLFRKIMARQRAMSMMISIITSGIIGVILALNGMSYWGIATQNLIYISCTTCCYWFFSDWRPTFHIDFRPIKQMISFSSKLLITNIFGHINYNILSVIIGKFYTEEEVGDFNQANKWNFMGYSVVAGMVNGVAQPILASVVDDRKRQRRVFRKMLRFTAFVAFPSMFGLSLITPELITITITSKWEMSAEILRILCVGSAFTSIVSLYSNLIISKGKSGVYMKSTIALGIIQCIVMFCCYPYGVLTMVKIYVCINIFWLLVWQYFVWKEIRLSFFLAMKDILPYAVIAGGVMLGTGYITSFLTNIYIILVAKITIAAAAYSAIMWISGSVTFKESFNYFYKGKP